MQEDGLVLMVLASQRLCPLSHSPWLCMSSIHQLLSTDSRPARRWSVDFAPLSAMAGMEDEEAEMPEVGGWW